VLCFRCKSLIYFTLQSKGKLSGQLFRNVYLVISLLIVEDFRWKYKFFCISQRRCFGWIKNCGKRCVLWDSAPDKPLRRFAMEEVLTPHDVRCVWDWADSEFACRGKNTDRTRSSMLLNHKPCSGRSAYLLSFCNASRKIIWILNPHSY
jgi:hypothetical protein